MKDRYYVQNYHNFISLPTEDENKPVFIDAGDLNSLKPREKRLTFEQIQYINLYSDAFKTGRIEFREEDGEELYEELQIEVDGSDYFTAEIILDIVKSPTKEKLEKVVKINDLNIIDLFRGIITSYKNLQSTDVSNRVMTVVNKRRDEIYKSPGTPTTITLRKTTNEIEMEAKEQAMEDAMASALEDMKKKLEAEYKKKLTSEVKKKVKAELDKAKKVEETK